MHEVEHVSPFYRLTSALADGLTDSTIKLVEGTSKFLDRVPKKITPRANDKFEDLQFQETFKHKHKVPDFSLLRRTFLYLYVNVYLIALVITLWSHVFIISFPSCI